MCVHILEVYMKRSHRVGAICQILTESPERVFNLKYFCDRFSAAKSSISEDISAAKEAVEATGYGYIETIPGAAGGVKYVPDISPEQAAEVQQHLCDLLREDGRILGGGFYDRTASKPARHRCQKRNEDIGRCYGQHQLFSRLVGKTSENVYFQKSCSPRFQGAHHR